MATFSQQLGDVRAPEARSAPVQSSGDTGTLASIAEAGMSVFGMLQQRKAQQAAVEQQTRLTGAQTALLDLEDQALNQSLAAQNIQATVQGIYADNQVTAEEQKTLEQLRKDVSRLDLLDPRQRQLRRNALHKQYLSDPANLGITPEINSLFQQGRKNDFISEPVEDKEFKQFMDNKYGPGNYTAVEVGEEIGKRQYLNNVLQTATTNINKAVAESGVVASTIGSDVLQQAATLLKTQGHIQDEQRAGLLGSLETERLGLHQQLAQVQAMYAERGVDVSAQVEKARKDFDVVFKSMSAPLLDKGAFGDAVRTSQMLENQVKILDNYRKLTAPPTAEVISEFMAKAGFQGIQGMLTILEANEATLAPLLERIPGIASVDDLKSRVAEAVVYALNPASLQDAAEQGLVNPRVLEFTVANLGLRHEDKAVVDANLQALEQLTGTATARADYLLSPKTAQNLKTVKPERLSSTILAIQQEMMEGISPSFRQHISVDSRGNIVADESSITVGKAAFKFNVQKPLEKLNKLLDEYGPHIGGKQQFVQSFLKELGHEGDASNE